MKLKDSFYILLVAALLGCTENPVETSKTKVLTSYTWGKPKILHIPVNIGVYTATSCDESFRFFDDKRYSAVNGCTGTVSGIWSWSVEGEEIYLDFGGITEFNTIVEVMHLSDTLLHTIERSEEQESGSGNYWEKKYYPR